MRVLIAAGGTAGHVVPALAVAERLRADGHEVRWVGGQRAEQELVPAAGFPLETIRVEGISRTNPLKAARAVGRAGTAYRAARRIVREFAPDVVLGGGGYVAGPVGAAASRAGIPIVLTEADSHLGLTNRLLASRARKVCLAFPIEGRTGEPYVVTGRPVPPPATDRAAARARFGLPDDQLCVLVFGGSLGARSINDAAIAGLPAADEVVLHAAGRRDFAALRERLAARFSLQDAGEGVRGEGYELQPYIDGFGEALLACDVCVARSGGSVFEVAAAGRPAILVPYPHAAADHQTGNARWMVDGGAAVLVADDELTSERLASEVRALLEDPDRLAAMAAASLALARPDAAATIAAEVLAAAAQGG